MSDTTGTKKSKRLWLGLLCLAVATGLAGGAYFAFARGGDTWQDDLTSGDKDRVVAALVRADADALRGDEGKKISQLTIESFKKMSIEEMMGIWDGKGLTEEQRRNLAMNMQIIMMNYMGDLAEKYFTAPAADKQALLDKTMDEFIDFGKKMEEYREAHKDDPEFKEMEQRQRDSWRKQTKDDRKQRDINMDPDRQMKMMYMFTQMQKRAKERGLDFGRRGRDANGAGKTEEVRRRPPSEDDRRSGE